MLIRLGLQAPAQRGRRRVPGGVPKCDPKCPGRPRWGLWGAPGAEEFFLRSCVRTLIRLGSQALGRTHIGMPRGGGPGQGRFGPLQSSSP